VVEEKQARIIELQKEIEALRLEIATEKSPFQIGDTIHGKQGFDIRVTGIAYNSGSDSIVVGHRVKKDGASLYEKAIRVFGFEYGDYRLLKGNSPELVR